MTTTPPPLERTPAPRAPLHESRTTIAEAPPSTAASSWRRRLHTVVFEADTPAGRAFDVALIVVILVSIATVMLESVAPIAARHGPLLRALEWVITAIFSAEYLLRLVIVGRPLRWALSFFGVVDLLAVISGWASVVVPGGQVFTLSLIHI